MTEVKRGRGRPRKVVEPEAPKNPDCEPATKGFVKCVARRGFNHTHENHVSSEFTFIGAIGGWVVFVFTLIGLGSSPTAAPIGWYPATSIAFAFAAVCSLVCLDLQITSEKHVIYPEDYKFEHSIQKYTPPVCEKKKEC